MSRTTTVLNQDWKFHRGECPPAWQKGWDDSTWRTVTLPHDWSVEEPFSQDHSSGTGYLPAGRGVYRKHFNLAAEEQGQRVRVTFEGVYNHSQVWCNGYYLGQRPSGYTSFSYDLSDFVHFGGDNVLTVMVHHDHVADSRWFTGSGIYRDVVLAVTDAVHFGEHGVFVTTPRVGETATVVVETTVENQSPETIDVELRLEVLTGAVVSLSRELSLAARGGLTNTHTLDVPTPRLWSPETPFLYTLRTQILHGGVVVDQVDTPFGIRTFRFDPDHGFFLNGQSVKLRGVCLHHDAGCLGAAVGASVWRRRLEALKDQGCNAIRTAHNPPSPALLDLCDQMVFLVMDEAFDEWEGVKNKWSRGHNVYPPVHFGTFEDFPEWGERDLKAMVLRDRNHPSIVLWSIGNEIDYPNDPYCHPSFQEMTGNNDANKPAAERVYDPHKPNAERLVPLAQKLVSWVKECDTTRPVTAALAFPELSNLTGLSAALDVVGYNYKEHLYEADHAAFPGRVIYGSENGSHIGAWKAVEDLPFNAGMFVWTGIDYLGEAKGWPIRAASPGFLNLAGTKKPRYYHYQSLWSPVPMAYLITRRTPDAEASGRMDLGEAHWNHTPGESVDVLCLTNAPEAELWVNGVSRGVRALDPERRLISWTLAYTPGTVEVKTRHPGAEVRARLETTTEPRRIEAVAHSALVANGQDVTEVDIFVVDDEGRRVFASAIPLTVTVEGPGQLLGLENGDVQDLTPYSSPSRTLHQGRLVAYVRATDQPGTVALRVRAEGLEGVRVTVESRGLS